MPGVNNVAKRDSSRNQQACSIRGDAFYGLLKSSVTWVDRICTEIWDYSLDVCPDKSVAVCIGATDSCLLAIAWESLSQNTYDVCAC